MCVCVCTELLEGTCDLLKEKHTHLIQQELEYSQLFHELNEKVACSKSFAVLCKRQASLVPQCLDSCGSFGVIRRN